MHAFRLAVWLVFTLALLVACYAWPQTSGVEYLALVLLLAVGTSLTMAWWAFGLRKARRGGK